MKTVIFATTNKGKFASAKRVLKQYGISTEQADIELPEAQSSLEEIAVNKVRFAYKLLRKPVIAMDAGFFIDSLNGFPMMYVKPVLQTIGVEGLLKLTEGKQRGCAFKEILCYTDNSKSDPKSFTRIVKGTLALKSDGVMQGKHWSELALIFIPEHATKTMAAMDEREYVKFREQVDGDSHFEQFAKFYSQR